MNVGYPIWCPSGAHYFTVEFRVVRGATFECAHCVGEAH